MINHDDDVGQAYEKTTLDNGLRVVTSSMPHTRSVTACVFVGVGSRYEDDERAGLSHFIEHLVFKGTSRRPDPKDVSGTVEAVGGEINAGTEHELTTYWSKVPEPHAEETLDLLVDMLRHSLLQSRKTWRRSAWSSTRSSAWWRTTPATGRTSSPTRSYGPTIPWGAR